MTTNDKAVAIAAHALGVRTDPARCDMCELHAHRESQQRGVIADMDRQYLLLRGKLEHEERRRELCRMWAYAGWGVAVISLLAAIR